MFLAVGHFERQNTLRQTVHIRNPTGLSMAGTSPPAAEATADGADGEQMAKKPPVDGTLQTPSPVDDTLDADTDSDADSDAEDGVRADGVRADVRRAHEGGGSRGQKPQPHTGSVRWIALAVRRR